MPDAQHPIPMPPEEARRLLAELADPATFKAFEASQAAMLATVRRMQRTTRAVVEAPREDFVAMMDRHEPALLTDLALAAEMHKCYGEILDGLVNAMLARSDPKAP